jgi:hypothetical protein
MNDQMWQSIRYMLIAGGSFAAGRGKISPEQVLPLVDQVMQVGGAVVAAGTAAWGLYVKFRTRAVPIKTAERRDVPTVSPVTGAVEPQA